MRVPIILAILLASPLGLKAQFDKPIPGLPGLGKKEATKFADVADWKAEFVPAQARPGEVIKLKVTVLPKPGNWTYPFFPPETQASKNALTPDPSNLLIFVGDITDPEGWVEKPSADPPLKDRVYKKPTTWEFWVLVSPQAQPRVGPVTLKGFHLQVCTEDNCFNLKEVSAPLEILSGGAYPVSAEYQQFLTAHQQGDPLRLPNHATRGSVTSVSPTTTPPTPIATKEPGSETVIKKKATSLVEHQAALAEVEELLGKQSVTREGGITGLLLTAAFWGLVSLATPCVFPMIPITVSLFLKQSNQSTRATMRLAGIYCGTIIVVLGISAIFLLSVFRSLSVDPYMNVFLGLLFVFFALSLFGMYEIMLPNSLLRFSEGKRKQGGTIGTVFGAIAFSIVSFTCVAPFLGGFAGMTASGQFQTWELVLAGLTFATAFAAPFFILAMFPSLLKQLPKSGGWLDSVKVVMGFLELAAALKFFRTAELRWSANTSLFTYDLVLTGWVVIALACGLYLLNMYRLPHDEEQPRIGVPRLLIALLFLGLSVYLLPGIFKTGTGEQGQRPRGVVYDWVDAFLLPEPGAASGEELPWGVDLPHSVKDAQELAQKTQQSQFVFVDFTGVTCTNCKANERSIFPLPAVKEQMRKYKLVQMYTDDVPADFYTIPPSLRQRQQEAEANLAFQKRVFGTEQLPLYVILEASPAGKVSVREVYSEGKINNTQAFVEFLAKPHAK